MSSCGPDIQAGAQLAVETSFSFSPASQSEGTMIRRQHSSQGMSELKTHSQDPDDLASMSVGCAVQPEPKPNQHTDSPGLSFGAMPSSDDSNHAAAARLTSQCQKSGTCAEPMTIEVPCHIFADVSAAGPSAQSTSQTPFSVENSQFPNPSAASLVRAGAKCKDAAAQPAQQSPSNQHPCSTCQRPSISPSKGTQAPDVAPQDSPTSPAHERSQCVLDAQGCQPCDATPKTHSGNAAGGQGKLAPEASQHLSVGLLSPSAPPLGQETDTGVYQHSTRAASDIQQAQDQPNKSNTNCQPAGDSQPFQDKSTQSQPADACQNETIPVTEFFQESVCNLAATYTIPKARACQPQAAAAKWPGASMPMPTTLPQCASQDMSAGAEDLENLCQPAVGKRIRPRAWSPEHPGSKRNATFRDDVQRFDAVSSNTTLEPHTLGSPHSLTHSVARDASYHQPVAGPAPAILPSALPLTSNGLSTSTLPADDKTEEKTHIANVLLRLPLSCLSRMIASLGWGPGGPTIKQEAEEDIEPPAQGRGSEPQMHVAAKDNRMLHNESPCAQQPVTKRLPVNQHDSSRSHPALANDQTRPEQCLGSPPIRKMPAGSSSASMQQTPSQSSQQPHAEPDPSPSCQHSLVPGPVARSNLTDQQGRPPACESSASGGFQTPQKLPLKSPENGAGRPPQNLMLDNRSDEPPSGCNSGLLRHCSRSAYCQPSSPSLDANQLVDMFATVIAAGSGIKTIASGSQLLAEKLPLPTDTQDALPGCLDSVQSCSSRAKETEQASGLQARSGAIPSAPSAVEPPLSQHGAFPSLSPPQIRPSCFRTPDQSQPVVTEAGLGPLNSKAPDEDNPCTPNCLPGSQAKHHHEASPGARLPDTAQHMTQPVCMHLSNPSQPKPAQLSAPTGMPIPVSMGPCSEVQPHGRSRLLSGGSVDVDKEASSADIGPPSTEPFQEMMDPPRQFLKSMDPLLNDWPSPGDAMLREDELPCARNSCPEQKLMSRSESVLSINIKPDSARKADAILADQEMEAQPDAGDLIIALAHKSDVPAGPKSPAPSKALKRRRQSMYLKAIDLPSPMEIDPGMCGKEPILAAQAFRGEEDSQPIHAADACWGSGTQPVDTARLHQQKQQPEGILQREVMPDISAVPRKENDATCGSVPAKAHQHNFQGQMKMHKEQVLDPGRATYMNRSDPLGPAADETAVHPLPLLPDTSSGQQSAGLQPKSALLRCAAEPHLTTPCPQSQILAVPASHQDVPISQADPPKQDSFEVTRFDTKGGVSIPATGTIAMLAESRRPHVIAPRKNLKRSTGVDVLFRHHGVNTIEQLCAIAEKQLFELDFKARCPEISDN